MYDDEIEFVLEDMGRNVPPASEIAEALVNHGVNYMMARDRMSPFAVVLAWALQFLLLYSHALLGAQYVPGPPARGCCAMPRHARAAR